MLKSHNETFLKQVMREINGQFAVDIHDLFDAIVPLHCGAAFFHFMGCGCFLLTNLDQVEFGTASAKTGDDDFIDSRSLRDRFGQCFFCALCEYYHRDHSFSIVNL